MVHAVECAHCAAPLSGAAQVFSIAYLVAILFAALMLARVVAPALTVLTRRLIGAIQAGCPGLRSAGAHG